MQIWKRVARLFVMFTALSSQMFKAVVPHLSVPESLLSWIRPYFPSKGLETSDEPDARTRLIADVMQRCPPWSSMRELHSRLDLAAWSHTYSQLQTFRSFLERVAIRKELGMPFSDVTAIHSRILETCALHLDYAVLLRAALGDKTTVARIRSIYTNQSPIILLNRPETSFHTDEATATIKQIWSTLLSETPSKRCENLLLLDVWASANQQLGQCRAAASVVYSMLLLNFLRDCGDSTRPEQVCEIFDMVLRGALAVNDGEAPPPSWFSQMAAIVLGVSVTPKPRC